MPASFQSSFVDDLVEKNSQTFGRLNNNFILIRESTGMISERICRSRSPCSHVVPLPQSSDCSGSPPIFPPREESSSEDGAFCHILCKVKRIRGPSPADSTLSYCGRLLVVASVWAFKVYPAQALPARKSATAPGADHQVGCLTVVDGTQSGPVWVPLTCHSGETE